MNENSRSVREWKEEEEEKKRNVRKTFIWISIIAKYIFRGIVASEMDFFSSFFSDGENLGRKNRKSNAKKKNENTISMKQKKEEK